MHAQTLSLAHMHTFEICWATERNADKNRKKFDLSQCSPLTTNRPPPRIHIIGHVSRLILEKQGRKKCLSKVFRNQNNPATWQKERTSDTEPGRHFLCMLVKVLSSCCWCCDMLVWQGIYPTFCLSWKGPSHCANILLMPDTDKSTKFDHWAPSLCLLPGFLQLYWWPAPRMVLCSLCWDMKECEKSSYSLVSHPPHTSHTARPESHWPKWAHHKNPSWVLGNHSW